jgi:hypothetical protein
MTLCSPTGEIIRITGTNLGPAMPRSYVSAVWYGIGVTRYDISNCTFTVPHQQLECVTLPGVGTGHFFQLTVLSQTTAVSASMLAYGPPSISAVLPTSLRTLGGTVSVSGLNFGLSLGNVVLLVNGRPAAASMPVAHSELQFLAEDLSGLTSLTVSIVVGGQSSSSVVIAVQPPALSTVRLYDITSLPLEVRATDNCALAVFDADTQTVVEVDGDNFGSNPTFLSTSLVNSGA